MRVNHLAAEAGNPCPFRTRGVVRGHLALRQFEGVRRRRERSVCEAGGTRIREQYARESVLGQVWKLQWLGDHKGLLLERSGSGNHRPAGKGESRAVLLGTGARVRRVRSSIENQATDARRGLDDLDSADQPACGINHWKDGGASGFEPASELEFAEQHREVTNVLRIDSVREEDNTEIGSTEGVYIVPQKLRAWVIEDRDPDLTNFGDADETIDGGAAQVLH